MSLKRMPIEFLKKVVGKIQARRERNRWYRKIAGVYKVVARREENIPLDIQAYRKRWEPLQKNVDTRWYKTYSFISGKPSLDYVPEDIYYLRIEQLLNRCEFYRTYRDKNMYDKFTPRYRDVFPFTLLRNIEGIFLDRDYRPVTDVPAVLAGLKTGKIVVKPSIETGSGRNVNFFVHQNGKYIDKNNRELTVDYLDRQYDKNFLLQDYIPQHEYFSRFNPTSLNSIRLTTYRSVKSEEVVPVHANLRMGGKGAWVDNQNAGGIAIHVNDDGTLNPYATDRVGRKHYHPPYNPDLKFTDMGIVPHFEDMKKIARQMAPDYHYFRMLGFDFCLQQDGTVRLIEINFCGLGINFQMDSGPLFRDYTDEVIDYCAADRRSKTACC